MSIDTINPSVIHAKSVISKIQSNKELPFKEILPAESITKALADLEYRDRIFTPDLTIFAFLAQVMEQDQSCQNAVTQVIAHRARHGEKIPSVNTAAYCKARTRLPEEVLSGLAKETAEVLEKEVNPALLWRNRHIKLPDGTTVSMPDTPANQAAYPQPRSQKKGVGFPIARMVGVFSLSTGALFDLAMAPWSGKGTGEHTLLRQLMHVFESGDIVIGDAYYASFFLIAALVKKGVDVVFPQNASRACDFRKGKRLGKGDHLVGWKRPAKPKWMSMEEYAELPEKIIMRETKTVSCRPGIRSMPQVTVSTFIDEKTVMPDDLGQLYSLRWFVELNLRSVKETMRMGILSGKTPSMVRKEIWAHILAYNLVRRVMLQAAVMYQRIPRKMSFKLALQVMLAFRQAGILCEENCELYARFLKVVVSKKTGQQRGRSEPRMIKRRPKAFRRMQKPRAFYRKQAEAA